MRACDISVMHEVVCGVCVYIDMHVCVCENICMCVGVREYREQ